MVRRIKKAAVIGSGIMGGGIAALLAGAGVDVLLLDIVPFDLKDEEKNDPAARNRIVAGGLEGIKKSRPPLLFSKDDLAHISIGNLEDDFDKLAGCDWIVEVVVENLKIKKDLFKRIDGIRKPDAIISSNTSGIPLRDMAEGLSQSFREHFLITHFFNPVRYMHLLENVPGPDTKKEVLDFIDDFCTVMLGKGMVWAKDTPNFIGNRIGIYGICKQLNLMLEDGITVAEVDAVMGAPIARPRTATFGTCDLVGMDTISHVVENTYIKCVDDEEREIFVLPPFVKTMLEKKQFGNKTKCGFFKTEVIDGKKVKKTINPATGEHEVPAKVDYPCLEAAKKAKTLGDKLKATLYGDDKLSKFAWKANAATYIYSANRIPEIADTLVDIDNGMKWGYNWEAGPFESWDALGVKESVEKMEKDGMKVPGHVKKMLAKGATTFYKLEKGVKMFWDFKTESYLPIKLNAKNLDLGTFKAENKVALTCPSASLVDIGDGVFCLEFHTKMNSLNIEIFDFMPKAYEYVDKNGAGLVVGNQSPAAFSAGGDLKGMLEAAKAGKFDELETFMKSVHAGMMGLRYSAYPTVAAAFGRALGGGAEVCLACDRIVAHMELNIALVEIGAGLLPGGCGMIQLWRKFTTAKPDAATITDLAGFFVPIFKMVVQPAPSMSAAEARAKGFLGPQDRIVMNRDLLIGEAKKEVLKMVDDGYTAPTKKKIAVFGQEAQGMIAVELKNMRTAGLIPPHMEHIAKQICWCLSGGDVPSGTLVSEDYLMDLERKAFVDLWRTENTKKMAEHIMTTGKSLLI